MSTTWPSAYGHCEDCGIPQPITVEGRCGACGSASVWRPDYIRWKRLEDEIQSLRAEREELARDRDTLLVALCETLARGNPTGPGGSE